jgi:hypothetical protein
MPADAPRRDQLPDAYLAQARVAGGLKEFAEEMLRLLR